MIAIVHGADSCIAIIRMEAFSINGGLNTADGQQMSDAISILMRKIPGLDV